MSEIGISHKLSRPADVGGSNMGLKMHQLHRISFIAIFVCTSGLVHAQTGLIRGTLLDTNGNPLAKADVFATLTLRCGTSNEAPNEQDNSGGQSSCFPTSEERVDAVTDEAGNFELQGLQWGGYELLAQKPEDGYCSLLQEPMRILLSPASPDSEVIFHLPPKCALLTGRVKNAKTGKLLSGVTLRVRRENDTDFCTIIGTPVPIHQLIPSQWKFTLEILAQGFETWAYRVGENPGRDAPPMPLSMQAGENLDLDVPLIPLSKAAVAAKPYGIGCPATDTAHEDTQH
jgi:hypothetical protein